MKSIDTQFCKNLRCSFKTWSIVCLELFLKYKKVVILTTNQQLSMNLKYNRFDMKNESRKGKSSMKLRKRPTPAQKFPLHKPKASMRKKSPPTREFGIDLTNRPKPIPIQVHSSSPPKTRSPSQITPYLSNIIQHISSADQLFTARITAHLLSKTSQDELKISPDMRRVLLRWLLQVGKKFQVKAQTMHICVQLIDLILVFEPKLINKLNFQLLGVASLFVASKYNEIHTFQAEKYIFLCDGLYNLNQLFEMESLILSVTQFNLQLPTLQQFTELALQEYDKEVINTVNELNNLALFDFGLFNRYQKQHLAATILNLSVKISNGMANRPQEIIEELQVPEAVFRQCYSILVGLYRNRQDIL